MEESLSNFFINNFCHGSSAKLCAAGVYEIASVKPAVLEQNGQLSLIQYGE
nr:YetF domain-containing protein [Haemophilus paraphrohaemolyticus]